MMSLFKMVSINLSQLVDARDWPLITTFDSAWFQSHLPVFLEQYLSSERDNMDDLLTLGITCGGNSLVQLDHQTISWLENHLSPQAVEIASNLLAGCWHPQLYKLPLDTGLLKRLLDCCVQVTLTGDQWNGFQQLLIQLSGMPAAASLPISLRKQLNSLISAEA